ncbi:hypothetical protein VFPFJ_00776 [Purpureocillium lilacinum]|uniref:Uncharacterized protein n=1 Tax=Purpureocillium lilacinum TaxID=33203 RepID=A0A179H8W5_PURLI|nr:hypothetical protein VFPFJ_00776 [Purpureocillium lilacinum]OAQ86706.1 hypothetical protein VFPBJ_00746 [Purpureocillium lilacinum]OAQ94667.1 hypothetical protein VFPFJ_00776 [Purpureocillium lilacinum]
MKPLRAFPFPLNVGTDICQISRIYTILRGPRRARFVNRILAPEELAQRDPRLAFLAGVGTTKSSSQTSAREAVKHDAEVALRETPLWKSAAFLAGRCDAQVRGQGGGHQGALAPAADLSRRHHRATSRRRRGAARERTAGCADTGAAQEDGGRGRSRRGGGGEGGYERHDLYKP